jgi:hypothetical protein
MKKTFLGFETYCDGEGAQNNILVATKTASGAKGASMATTYLQRFQRDFEATGLASQGARETTPVTSSRSRSTPP